MNIDTQKIKTWFIDKFATIVLTLVMGLVLRVCTVGFNEARTFYAEFNELKKNSQADLIAHRQIAVRDSLLAVYKDTVNNRLLTIEGTMEAHQEKLIELSGRILKGN